MTTEVAMALTIRSSLLVVTLLTPAAAPAQDTPQRADLEGQIGRLRAQMIEVDANRRHDLVLLRVRRLEADSAMPVAETELGQDQPGVDLPIDRSGGLYVVDWSTSDGQAYALQLKDGATGLPAAVVQVKPFQSSGRFVFVGYRLE
jgi:hypothetical protein